MLISTNLLCNKNTCTVMSSSMCGQKCNSFTRACQSLTVPNYKFISCYFLFFGGGRGGENPATSTTYCDLESKGNTHTKVQNCSRRYLQIDLQRKVIQHFFFRDRFLTSGKYERQQESHCGLCLCGHFSFLSFCIKECDVNK